MTEHGLVIGVTQVGPLQSLHFDLSNTELTDLQTLDMKKEEELISETCLKFITEYLKITDKSISARINAFMDLLVYFLVPPYQFLK